MRKYVFVTGGVLSSVGKGIAAASIALILKSMGYSVTAIKIDPYVNVDSGTMNPYMHGEVFVTEDGAETDLDLGHYERFLDVNLTRDHNITTGQVYGTVIERERRGEYLGQCVQIIPHVTDEIKARIRGVAEREGADITIVEIGGTVGDIEGLPFLEAARQMRLEEGARNVVFVHVALVPILSVTGEQKTKPLQHSVNELRRIGIQPDIIIGRCDEPLNETSIYKIALFGNVPRERVFSSHSVDTIYRVPLMLEEQGMSRVLSELLALNGRRADLSEWSKLVKRFEEASREVTVGMVGKYVELTDSYVSIKEALVHAGIHHGVRVRLKWVEAEWLEGGEDRVKKYLDDVDGLIILPGFGARGAEGKIAAAKYARERGKPLLGICFGFQLAIVEFARNVVGLKGANSTEIDPKTPHPVIDLLPEQREIDRLGGTMRLGAYKIKLKQGTLANRLYGRDIIYERHRHRYEVNPRYWDVLQEHGLVFSGWDSSGRRIEFAELPFHPFYLLTQAHPEFKSRPNRPSPPFMGFLEAILKHSPRVG